MAKRILLVCVSFLLFLACESIPVPEPTASVDVADTQQLIRGFGGMSYPHWIDDLTSDQVDTAFGDGPGQIGMSILRIHVPYDSAQFTDEVATALRAQSLGAIVFASPWTPPAAMKTNGSTTGGSLAAASYADYAAHLKSFCDYMEAQGAPLYAVSLQNEPDISVNYDSCDWTPTEMISFLKDNSDGIGSTRIIAAESFNFNHARTDPILNDPDAASKVSIIGGHVYGGGIAGYPLAVSQGKEIWMTEHYVDSSSSTGSGDNWTKSMNVAREIDACMNAGMNAYVWWYIRRFYGPIAEDGHVTKTGYVMSQYARFARPGFRRVGASVNAEMDVRATAYQDGSTVVIVIVNGDSRAHTLGLKIQNATVATLTPYVTSAAKDCEEGSDIEAAGGVFTVPLDASSVTTVAGSY